VLVAIAISRYARDVRTNGATDLGVDLEEHIAFCIEAMKEIAVELGLAGVNLTTDEHRQH
jgi:predicted hydrolase (HD superfamily)